MTDKVKISKVALYALMTATMARVASRGAYAQQNEFGEIENPTHWKAV